MLAAQARQLFLKSVVIRLPVSRHPAIALGRVGRAAFAIQRRAAKRFRRAQGRGGLPGIQALVVRWPVQVDHVARHARAEDRRAECAGEAVEAVEVPVSIRDRQRDIRVPVAQGVGNVRAEMRNGDYQRRIADFE